MEFYAYTAMIIAVEISHLGYIEALIETMITHFLSQCYQQCTVYRPVALA
jgi:hypothetical protein